jgi:hypothetical protein
MEPRAKVFGNSDSFDNSAVKHAMKSFEIVPAWDHGCDQNLRTAVLMGRILLGFDPKKDLVFKGNKHCALDDALHESEYLYLIFKAFEEKLS